MEILSNEIIPFYKGEKFSDQLKVIINKRYYDAGRWTILKEYMRNKTVVHVGCLDHVPLIEKRIKNNDWIHKNISDISKRCIGIDIECNGVEYVKSRFGVKNILCADITKDVIPEVYNDKWDFIFLGEVLEHIDNPVLFLKDIKEKYKNIDKIIITVPNVLNRYNYILSKHKMEIINSDHRYWFTPYTISKILFLADIEIEDIMFANLIPLYKHEKALYKIKKILKKEIKYKFNFFNNIILIGKL